MESKSGFQRFFLIFGSEDPGYDTGQKPSGHVRIEVRDGRGKLRAAVQNLADDNGRFNYNLYMIKSNGGMAIPVHAGTFRLTKGRGELEWEFNPFNVSVSANSIEEFNVAAVLVEYPDRKNTAVICPLAAYKGKKHEWRSGLREYLDQIDAMTERQLEEENTSKYAGVAESKYKPPETDPDFNLPDLSKDKQVEKEGALVPNYPEDYYPPEPQVLPQAPPQVPPQAPTQAPPQAPPQVSPVLPQMPFQGFPRNVYPGVNTNCLYMNGNMCGAYLNTGSGNPCANCQLHSQAATVNRSTEIQGDMEKLKLELDRNFERSDPFQSKRSDYKWWKVTNPVNLNNILYQCNIRSPLLFNPMVMMAHYKYRYLVVGIYDDRVRKMKYVQVGAA